MFKKLTYILLITALIMLLDGREVYGQELETEMSASLKNPVSTNSFDYRMENLRNFLEKYESPLVEYADEFVIYADTYGLDYRMVPAITGVESTFGKHIPYKSYNAYGWANGDYRFTSWENSIQHVSMTLKLSYIDKGAPTIAKIARRYAPPSTTWGGKVKYFVGKIDTLPLTFDI